MARVDVDFGAKTSRFRRGVAGMENRVQKFGNTVKNIFGAALVAFLTRGIIRALGNIANEIDKIGKLASRTGIGARQLQILSRVALKAGADIEVVARAYSRFNRELQLGATAQTEKALASIGTTIDDIRGKTPEETLRNLAMVFNDIVDPAQKSALAIQLFGQRGEAMINVLQGLADETKEFRTLSDQQVRNIEKMNDAWTDLKNGIAAAAAEVVAFFAATPRGAAQERVAEQLIERGMDPRRAFEVSQSAPVTGDDRSLAERELGRTGRFSGPNLAMRGIAGVASMFGAGRGGGEEQGEQGQSKLEKFFEEAIAAEEERQDLARKSREAEQAAAQEKIDGQVAALEFEKAMLTASSERAEIEARIARLKGQMADEEDPVAQAALDLEKERLEVRRQQINERANEIDFEIDLLKIATDREKVELRIASLIARQQASDDPDKTRQLELQIQQLREQRRGMVEQEGGDLERQRDEAQGRLNDARRAATDPRNVIADSLQAIGGGGVATTTDADFFKRKAEEQIKLLNSIDRQLSENRREMLR